MSITITIEHFILWLLALLLRKKPSSPKYLRATLIIKENGSMNVQLNWGAPTLKPGQSAVKKYRVYSRADGAPSFGLLGETDPATLQLLDENVSAGIWSYQVTYVDAKDREGPPSNTVTVTVDVEPDSVAPGAPGTLTAVVQP